MGSFALLSRYKVFCTVINNRKVHSCSCKVPDIVVQFYPNLVYHQIFVEVSKIKFHENFSSGSRAGSLGQTDRQRRMEICDDAERYFSLFMRKRLANQTC
jgi:hypothetical protein